MRIKITSDSTCDLPQTLLEQHDITVLPLYINMGNRTLQDGIEVMPKDIYAFVENGGEICSTSAISIGDYSEKFAQLRQEYDAVIHINLGAKFSSCYQNACIAASELTGVYVVDSCNLTVGQGLVALHAAELAESGMAPEELVEELHRYVAAVDASFMPQDLNYLRKGGRCSSVAALGANLLQLRPCIAVQDGVMLVRKKYRGSQERCIEQYLLDCLGDKDTLDTRRMFVVTSGGFTQEELAVLDEKIRAIAPCEEILHADAGCTICSHCGPRTVSLVFVRK